MVIAVPPSADSVQCTVHAVYCLWLQSEPGKEESIMPSVTGLGHVGLFVREPAAMVDFYENFLGLTVTDRGPDDRIVFLSARPEAEHHELALVKSDDRKTDPQQLSFTVDSLTSLKAFWEAVKERNYPVNRVTNHGNALGCYFQDPEGNNVEVYWPTGKDVPQPHGDPIDLDRSEAELRALLDSMPTRAHATAG
jgi:catechol-2,3-dioxygenase